MNAIDVIRIGRSLKRAASMIASQVLAPACSRARANSTIRIAFFAASPTSTMRPICVKMLLSPPASQTPAIADEQRHRHDQDHDERQRQALVERREHEEHEQHGEREHPQPRVAGELLLVRELGPLGVHAVRQRRLREPRDQRLGLTGRECPAPGRR